MQISYDDRADALLQNGAIIYQSDSRTITVEEAIAFGGTAVVYKVNIEEGSRKYKALAKEIFPKGCYVLRSRDDGFTCRPEGQLFVYSDDEKFEAFYKKLIDYANTEVIAQNQAALTNKGFVSDYFFRQSEYISQDESANGNCYIILDTTDGFPLSETMKSAPQCDNDVSILCGYISCTLRALEKLHKKEMLHLDVAPDNVFISDTGIARLIDYNSAFIKDNADTFHLSCKAGFTAPEIMYMYNSRTIDTDQISIAADIYSVAAILYRMIYGEFFSYKATLISPEIDRRNLEKTIRDIQIIPPRPMALLRKILLKGLASLPEDRYSSAAEMCSDIEKLQKLTASDAKYLIGNKHLTPPDNCIPRASMLEKISNVIKQNNHVIVSGVGGCGKSELAVMYALAHKDEYDTVCVMSYMDDIRDMICSLNFHGINHSDFRKKDQSIPHTLSPMSPNFESIDTNALFAAKAELLKSESSRTLFIVEDYTAEIYKELPTLISIAPQCHMIINTRGVFDSTTLVKMDDISNDEAYNFFVQASGRTDETTEICEIIRVVNKHILLMKLLALHLKSYVQIKASSLLQLLTDNQKLDRGTLEYSHTINGISTISDDSVIEAHLAKVFNISNLSDEQCFILSAMTLVPYTGMKHIDFATAMKLDEFDKTVTTLIKRGWITEKNGIISLHQAISDYLYRTERTMPDWERLDDFVGSNEMLGLATLHCASTKEQNNITLKNLVFFQKRITGETLGCGLMLVQVARCISNHYSRFANEQKQAIKCCYCGLEIFKKMTGKNSNYTEQGYYWLAFIYMTIKDYQNAVENFKHSLEICKYLYGELSAEVADRYEWLSYSYNDIKIYEKALECGLESLRISKIVFGEISRETFDRYEHLSYINTFVNNDNAALEYRKKALQVCIELDGKSSWNVGFQHLRLADKYISLKQYDNALECFNNALNTQYYNETNIGSYFYEIADMFSRAERYDKSIEYYKRALEFYSQNTHGDSNRIISCYKYISHCYYSSATKFYRAKQYNQAITDYKYSLALCKEYGESTRNIENTYYWLAMSYYGLGQYETAITHFKHSLVLCDKIYPSDSSFSTAVTHFHLAETYEKLDNSQAALEHATEALRIFKAIDKKDSDNAIVCQSLLDRLTKSEE